MPSNDFQDLVLSELKELKQDVKDVRLTDIPGIREDIAGFHEKIKTLENQQKWSTRLYTLVGGIVAVGIAKFTNHGS